jgi:DNA mismatch repair protein MutL
MTIRRLDESTVVRIAAGEVIERPASVVKELVENAFDAGARVITVRIERGGLGVIEVADDGGGIPAGELPVAVERHATSKIRDADDLDTIRTMGFRGEALAAIAAAAGRMSIVSRVEGADAAELVLDESFTASGGGVGQSVRPAARAMGTSVVVHDLFAKTPARLKFMKSESSEFGRISSFLERLALARPDVAIELMRDRKRVFRTAGRGDLRETVAELFGADTARDLLEVREEAAIRVEGLIGPTHVTRPTRTGLHYHVLGRPIEDRSIAHAIVSAYEGLLPSGRFPVVFLGIHVDPSEVDVNVHPAKAEVRFRDPQRVHRLVSQSLRARLRGDAPVPLAADAPLVLVGETASAPGPAPMRQSVLEAVLDFERPLPRVGGIAPSFDPRPRDSDTPAGPESAARPSADPVRGIRLRYLAEVAGKYLIAESSEGLVIVDQHAAHERVIFDRLMTEAQNGAVTVSPLLTPVLIEASASDRAIAADCVALLAEIGIEIEVWPDAIAVKAVPALMSGLRDAGRIIRDVIESAKEGGSPRPNRVPYERLAREACKSAVLGATRLAPEIAVSLLEELARTTDPYNCPHGRPTMIRLPITELDRRFGRI